MLGTLSSGQFLSQNHSVASAIPSLTASQGALRIPLLPLAPLSSPSSCSTSNQALFFPKVEQDYTLGLCHASPCLVAPLLGPLPGSVRDLLRGDTSSHSLLQAYPPPSPESQLLSLLVSLNLRAPISIRNSLGICLVAISQGPHTKIFVL